MRSASSVDTVIAVPLAVAAGATFAVASVLQQRVARTAPRSDALHLRLLVDLARRRVWVAGVLLGVLSFGLQGLALTFGPLALVQPLIVTDLLFALPLAARLYRVRPGRREYAGAAAIAGGLALFLVTAHPSAGLAVPALYAWVPVLAGVGGAATVLVTLGQRTTGALRTSLLAAAAGAAFGLMSALLKAVTHLLSEGLVATFGSWEIWALSVSAIGGFVLAQSAFQAGPLAISLPLIDVLEPVTATVIGATAFREAVPLSASSLTAQAGGALMVVVGIVLLDGSPLVREAQRAAGVPAPRPSDVGIG